MSEKETLSSLSKAFEIFNQTTFDLQDYYSKLERQAQHLSAELENKNRELHRKVLELDTMRGYLNNVLESITDGVVAVDLKGFITTCNQASLDLTGYKSSQLMGKKIKTLLTENQLYDLYDSDRLKIRINKSGIETTIASRDNRQIPVILFTALIANENGEVIGAVFTFKDLSLIKKLEDEVERSHRLASIGEMAAGVAHEIRNPLGGIEMFASILEKDFADGDSRKTMTLKILEGVRRINKIVSEMLNFTRSFHRTQFLRLDLISVLKEAMDFARVEIEARKAKVCWQFPEGEEFEIQGDPDQLKQLFLNLFLNSIQALKSKGGKIEVKLSREHETITVAVVDNGKGIAQEHISKIFDPFFTTRPDGNGLGLAICHRIVEAHRGKIQVQSRLSYGTTMTIQFPAFVSVQ